MKPLIVSAVLAAAGSLHAAPLTAQHTVGDLLAMPAFAPFAERLLPWDGRPADKNLPLSQLGRLMPYHSAVNTADILGALNGLQQRAVQGQSVFYELYSPQERAADPAKAYTGLFFYPGKTGAPFALIAPGGGFQYVGTLHEGLPLARRIAEAGYPAFVVKYRAGQGQQAATQDMARALAFIRQNASRLGVAADGYSLWGASAGARMAASIGSYGASAFGANDTSRPAAVILQYTGHSDYSRREPPTFAVVGEHDGIAPPALMAQRIRALQRQGTPAELHRYPNTGHGFALGSGTPAAGWEKAAIRFWQQHRSAAP